MKIYLLWAQTNEYENLMSLHATRKCAYAAYHDLRREMITDAKRSIAYWERKPGATSGWDRFWIRTMKRNLAALESNNRRGMRRHMQHGIPTVEVRKVQP